MEAGEGPATRSSRASKVHHDPQAASTFAPFKKKKLYRNRKYEKKALLCLTRKQNKPRCAYRSDLRTRGLAAEASQSRDWDWDTNAPAAAPDASAARGSIATVGGRLRRPWMPAPSP